MEERAERQEEEKRHHVLSLMSNLAHVGPVKRAEGSRLCRFM